MEAIPAPGNVRHMAKPQRSGGADRRRSFPPWITTCRNMEYRGKQGHGSRLRLPMTRRTGIRCPAWQPEKKINNEKSLSHIVQSRIQRQHDGQKTIYGGFVRHEKKSYLCKGNDRETKESPSYWHCKITKIGFRRWKNSQFKTNKND